MFTRAGVVELVDVAEPVVGSGETIVHVESVGIRGSELHGGHETFRLLTSSPGGLFLRVVLDPSWGTPLPFSESADTFLALAQGRYSIVKALLQPQNIHDPEG